MKRLVLALLAVTITCGIAISSGSQAAKPAASAAEPHRSPIALAISADGSRLLSANQTADSVTLVDAKAGKVLNEISTGEKPAGVALSPDGKRGVVVHWYGYDIALLDIDGDRLKVAGRVEVGPEPRGVVLTKDAKTAYVTVGVTNEVVRVDLDSEKVTGRLTVGREPRGIALTPDGARLVVSNGRGKSVSVIATAPWTVERTIPIEVDNLRQVAITSDGKTAYIPGMRNQGFATTAGNIDLGWVLGQRLIQVSIESSEPFGTLSLDPRGKATSDAHGAAVSSDGRYVAVSCGGTHEVLLFRTDLKKLPWRSGSAGRDLIAKELLSGDGRFRRVNVGGRPTEVAFGPDNKTLYVANYLSDAVQVIDADSAKLVQTIPLGGPKELSLERRGEILFHAAERSFNQWYSCNTCHSEGHTNGLDFDTLNDGRQDLSTQHKRSRKKVPTLRRVTHTAPWTWHGWQKSLDDATVESFTKSMQGKRPKAEESKAMVAYLATLDFPRNPYRAKDGTLSAAEKRGEAVYRSAKAGCSSCHGGAELTDGKIHLVGLEERDDAYRGYNPPSLRGVYDKDPYLHDGRAKTLREALSGPHSPDVAGGGEPLNDSELDDLLAYLRTL